MATIKLFAQLREVAGTREVIVEGNTVAEVIANASSRFGTDFTALLSHCKVWLDGEPCEGFERVTDSAEIAILPPVSGG